jgi:NAD(P)-dependent dehydrogenase (short-subunit alcohol dehydrogenase family)
MDIRDDEHSGKIAVVTGGMGGLGRHVVERFLRSGMKVAVPVRGGSTAERIPAAWEFRRESLYLAPADVSRETDVRRFLADVEARLGGVDILFNGAGGYAGGESVGEAPMAVYDDMLDMNLRTAILMSSNVLHGMRQRNFGRILSVAAKAALVPAAGRGPYGIAKGGIISLTETIAAEVAGTGITANAIAPSVIVTEENRDSMPGADASKWVTPGEIAELALFLCSRSARSISGNVVKIYGGV